MSFVSLEYAVLLAAVLGPYRALPPRLRLGLTLVASYVFYCYGQPSYGYIIASTTVLDYGVGLALGRTERPGLRRLLLFASIAGNLAMLGYFKYGGFVLDTLRPLLGEAGAERPRLAVALPPGISFYTFQEISYTIEVYRRRLSPTRDLVLFGSYVSFFPQLVAGPIEKPQHLLGQLASPQPLRAPRLSSGLGLILVGLAKKLVLADRLAPFAHSRFTDPSAHDGFELLVALFVMPIALYLDFGGYTDIARGSARLLGIELSRNFLFPFAARNPSDFWNRWHITLTRFMRDYVFKAVPGRPEVKLLVPAALMGLWHGASWTFVLWGVGNGLALVAYLLWRLHGPRARRRRELVFVPVLGAWVFRVYAILLAALFFCPDLTRAVAYWRGLFTGSWASFGDPTLGFLAVGVVAFLGIQFLGRDLDWPAVLARVPAPLRGLAFALLFYVVLFGAVPTAQQFVYVQF